MIFRKPYAFLIKNFKKIHLLLIFLCAYIFYKHLRLYHFIKEYVELESYSSFLEPISNYANFWIYFVILAVIVITLLLLITLKRKEKPWKLYLIIVAEYTLMLFAFGMATNFFSNYSDTTAVTAILVVRDLLLLASFAQYLVFIILFIRVTGLDLNKFSFATDQEYLELDSSDREEVEVNIEFDKHTMIRTFRKLKRNLNYFYFEHKFILNTLGIIFFVSILGYSYYYFGILHRSYKEGQTLRVSNYEITIENAYLSDKDYRGDKLDGDYYIILDLNVKNNGGRRTMNTDRFHLMNHNQDIVSNNLYDNDFKDLGTPYSKREFQSGKSYRFLLIFKADSSLDVNKFNLYYQEYISANETYLRKIKLKLKDLRTIEATTDIPLGEEQVIQINEKKKKVTMDKVEIGDSFPYRYYDCSTRECTYTTGQVQQSGENKILKVDFSSLDFTGEQFVDFSLNYGRIKYRSNNKKTKTIDVKTALFKEALNKSLYLIIPKEAEASSEIKLELTVRNHRYTFKLR